MLYLIETSFNTFANRADPDQAALLRVPDQGLLCLLNGNMIRYDPTLVDLTSNSMHKCETLFCINYS